VLSAFFDDGKVVWFENFPSVGVSYCGPAVTNSSGDSAEIAAFGVSVVAQN
jgi:hypothetical protein